MIEGCEVELIEEEFFDTVQDEGGVTTELSLNAFLGQPSPTTTKVRGVVGNREVIMMLDSGATHNFITPAVAKQAHLKLCHQQGLDVRSGTRIAVSRLGVCAGVKIQVVHVEFETDFIALELVMRI